MRYLNIIAIVLLWCMSSCSEVDLEGYNYDGFIQFEKSSSDSTTFSFAYDETLQVSTIRLKMTLISSMSEQARVFRVKFLEQESSARSGIDFEIPVDEQTVAASDSIAWFTFTVKRNPDLKAGQAVIVWEVEDSGDLKPGLQSNRRARVVISNQLTRPDWWGEWHETEGLGQYSELKFKTFVRVTGIRDMTLKTDGGEMDYSTMRTYVLKFKYWLLDNPTQDEDGSLMQVAMRG